MDKALMLWIASKAADKGWDKEKLYYSDDMHGQEQLTDDVWEYVIEYRKIGSVQFNIKYKEFKLF